MSDNTRVQFAEAFEDLNIPGDVELNVEYSVIQDWLFLNCHGDVCPKTDAEFRNTYNPAGKTIIAAHNFSPTYQLRKAFGVDRLSPDQAAKLPKVKQWSDVTMIMWNSLAGNRAGDLKYIFREYIITSNTRFVMEQCFQDIGEDELLKVWPGQVFKDDDPDFYALLGTPHGRSVAFLLIQHQDEFPGKSIESITVFTNSDDDIEDGYHLLFTLTGPGNNPLPDK
ncbi:hypothetical protein G7Y79_00032g066570 [Physcia stellaris]|nr:hypothetical protein G7Y79_00032g066570 [Physcia stellaris]